MSAVHVKIPDGLAQPDWGVVGEDVFRRTYSRIKPDGERECWAETVQRVVNGNCSFVDKQYIDRNEPEKLFDLIYNFKLLPGGRHLWVTGIKSRQFVSNCFAAFWSDSFADHFTYTFERLMEGGGVGANYSNLFLKKYKTIQNKVNLHILCSPEHNDYDLVADYLSKEYSSDWCGSHAIADSREGWSKALDMLLRAFYGEPTGYDFPGDDIVFDVTHVRPKGAKIRQFGGTATGPIALIRLLVGVAKLMNAANGTKPDSLLCMAIDHALAECVIAGNVRRSARLAMKHWKDEDIYDFINCKEDSSSHWTANISVALDKHFFKAYRRKEPEAIKLMDAVVKGCLLNGEPGIYNLTKSKEGEVGDVYACNPCVTADTLVDTTEGFRYVKDLIGEKFYPAFYYDDNGEDTTHTSYYHATFFKTGTKPVFKIETDHGYSLRCTEDHRILTVKDLGKTKKYVWKEAKTLTSDDTIVISPRLSQDFERNTSEFEKGWLVGTVLGDGGHNPEKYRTYLRFWGDDRSEIAEYAHNIVLGLERNYNSPIAPNAFPTATGIYSQSSLKALTDLCCNYLESGTKNIKNSVLTESISFQSGFLRGLFDTDGCPQGSSKKGRSVRLTQANEETLRKVQIMLLRFGVISKLYLNRNDAGKRFMPDGKGGTKEYECKAVHELIISRKSIINYAEHIGFRVIKKANKLEELLSGIHRTPYADKYYSRLKTIVPDGIQDVYDCTVPEHHRFSANGIVVHNCGEITLEGWESCILGSVNMAKFAHDSQGALEAFRLMSRFLLRATYADYPDPKIAEVVGRNRRIGVGFTGFADWLALEGVPFSGFTSSDKQKDLLKTAAALVRSSVREYAFQLRVPEPVKSTTCAPTGSTSKLCGCSEGMQPVLFKYFKRRICYSLNDPNQLKLINEAEAKGLHIEDSVYSPDTKVVTYVCRAGVIGNEGVDEDLVEEMSEISLEECLDVQKTIQEIYADNSISFTITVDAETVTEEELRSALVSFGPYLKGTTIMPMISNRPQMPYTRITKEEYEAATHKFTGAGETECKNGICHLVNKTDGDEHV